MRSSRLGLAVTAVIVVLLVGATVAVYAIDPGTQEAAPEAEGPVEGQTVFLTKGCTGCHSRAGISDGFIGPDLTNLADRAGVRVEGLTAEEYVRQSVLNPQAYIVSGYGGQMPVLPVDTEELDALVEFLLSDG
ncbi:MAG TPA: cytochrome c [Acidimicrobiia bacterium]|nr:cytochrome c [Acidimicrobiia bacterium]